jgi:5-hydroxyisourate hydrolase
MSTLSTHVLDTSRGQPAGGVRITLQRGDEVIGTAVTDDDGRVKDLSGGRPLAIGMHKLVFDVGEYFSSRASEAFYERITIEFVVSSESDHYHVPLLLSPFGYSTYRGS